MSIKQISHFNMTKASIDSAIVGRHIFPPGIFNRTLEGHNAGIKEINAASLYSVQHN